MLAMQLGIVCVVLVGVAAVSLAQSDARAHESQGSRALAIEERLAVTAGVREVVGPDGQAFVGQATSVAESGRTFSGSTAVLVAGRDRRVVASSDPLPQTPVHLQATEAFAGRSWVGEQQGGAAAMAMAPIINVQTRETDGVVAVVRAYPSLLDNLGAALPNLLTYLGIASLLGVVGSLLLASHVKRQTLGLEPREIAGLVEQREALLHGIKEGVVAVDLDYRVTMVNDGAAQLLGIPLSSAGHTLDEVDPTGRAASIFRVDGELSDHVLPVRGRVLIVNRMPVRSRGRHIGWVASMRDRTEMLELQRELDLTKSTTDTLRAQAHEFSNRMHVVSGMIALEEYDGVRNYIRQITDNASELTESVRAHVQDPAIAALLIAKTSQADERGVDLVVDSRSRMPQLDEALAADVNTVMGNLIDNAFDAAAGSADPMVGVLLTHDGQAVTVTVRDSGPGIDTTIGELVFERGFSTKGGPTHERGIGLAIVRVICRRRGGDIVVHNDDGAVFVATLPVSVEVPAG
jgi:sensor histidine kinase regulating citrate/malate metabolism